MGGVVVIDARRWVLTEAWLALGLRLVWCPSFEQDRVARDEWQGEGGRYLYEGDGVWWVMHPDRHRRNRLSAVDFDVPQLSTDDMRHELAHYLSATPDQREKRNFGMTNETYGQEEAAIAAERVIDAMCTATSRIASLALSGGRSS